MGVWVGIDVAKEVHWACAVDDSGQVLLDRRVDNDPAAIAALIEDLGGLGQGVGCRYSDLRLCAAGFRHRSACYRGASVTHRRGPRCCRSSPT